MVDLLKFTCDLETHAIFFPTGLELEKFTTSWKRTGGLTSVFVFIHLDKKKLSM